MPRPRESFPCPSCGAVVPAGAAACPGCGADERTGWSEQALDVPETHLDDERYEEFVREDLEGGEIKTSPPSRTAVGLIVILVLGVALLLTLLTMRR